MKKTNTHDSVNEMLSRTSDYAIESIKHCVEKYGTNGILKLNTDVPTTICIFFNISCTHQCTIQNVKEIIIKPNDCIYIKTIESEEEEISMFYLPKASCITLLQYIINQLTYEYKNSQCHCIW